MVRSRFRADVRRRRFRVVALRPNQYEAAEKLIDCHGVDSGLRALDSLQLACSLDLYRNNLIDFIVTADRILCRVSALENMTSINPEP